MKWITRERVKVDRVACPWLIKKLSTRMRNFFSFRPIKYEGCRTAFPDRAAPSSIGRLFGHVKALQPHGVARISRPFSGCVGRAFIGYICAKRATSALEMDVGVFSTNQVTPSLHGGVVREPVNV